jgi:hypothetical protein
MCMSVTPAVPYLLLGLQDVQWAVGNSRGARKLARTPHVNQKKKKKIMCYAVAELQLICDQESEFWVSSPQIIKC